MFLIFLCIVAISCLLLIRILSRFADRLHLLDEPNHRKQHHGHIPMVGGIAIFLSTALGIFLFNLPQHGFASFLPAALLLLIIGVIDDVKELSVRYRLLAQILCTLIVTLFSHEAKLVNLGNLFFSGPIHLAWLSQPITILGIVLIINAMNMLDGLDGLLGCLALMIIGFLIPIAFLLQQQYDFQLLSTLGVAILIFLFFNFPFKNRPARVFLGDAGSTFLGFVLPWISVHLSQVGYPQFSPVVFLWIFAVPIFDIVNTMLRRMALLNSPFKADRKHLHHILLSLTHNKVMTIALMCTLAFLMSLIGVMLNLLKVPEDWQFVCYVSSFIAYVIVYHTLALFNSKHNIRNLVSE